jgi:hypothetical protein
LKREQTVKDLTQKLSNLPLSPQEEKPSRVGDMSGLISKAKEELAKSKTKVEKTAVEELKKPEPKKSEIELHWEELMKNMDRDLMLCDLDFRDLTEDDDANVLQPRGLNGSSIPPPPPLQIRPPSIMNLNSIPMNGQVNGNGVKKGIDQDLVDKASKKTKKTVKMLVIVVHHQFTFLSSPKQGQTLLERGSRRYDSLNCRADHLGRVAFSERRHNETRTFV